MSSILKALEKVEESQNAKRVGGAGGFYKSRERRPAWVLPVGVLGGAAVAALATFAAMGGFSRHASHAPAKVEVAKAEPSAPLKAIVATEPAVKAEPPVAAPAARPEPAAAVEAPVQPAQPKAAQVARKAAVRQAAPGAAVPAKAAAPAVAKKGAIVQPALKVAKGEPKQAGLQQATALQTNPAPRPAAKKRQGVVPPPPVQAAVQTSPVPAAAAPVPVKRVSIAVTGIAWQNDSASSVAMVNGKTVRQGGSVDGYKVEQIFEDKVRFSGSNGNVDVPLSAGE